MKHFENANVYVEGKGVVCTTLSFGARIERIGGAATGEKVELPSGTVVCPGFIDQHVHGAGGADAMDGSTAALAVIADTLAKEGTTRFLATTMTQSDENIRRAMRAVKAYCKSGREEGAGLLGAHLEGPFISQKHIGAQPPEYVVKPNIGLFDAWQSESGNAVRLITLAPEEEGAQEFVRHAAAKGARVSAGHSDAGYEDVCRVKECGLTSVTHTFNAHRGVHHREIGVAGAAMLCDDLCAELIADGIHVSVPAMRLLYKNKPRGKLILITDSIRAKGIGEGESELGGQKVYVRGGEARLSNGALAGSVLAMNVAVRNLVQKAGVPFTDAIDCATINPAEHLGVAENLGSIRAGKCADFVVLDEHCNVVVSIRDGNIVYKA
ncbi:MAG: N-acetylglucosamine-6-phosphate deacetylase [Clostridiales bacterium]|nr:N-acetylglucosamine-6-phosphate deacetylase [Clostridiales bacterium]